MPTVVIGDNTGNDFAGTEDNNIVQDNPTLNSATTDRFLDSKFSAGTWQFGLIRFTGLTNITSPVTVSSATLSLDQIGSQGGTYNTDARRILQNWIVDQSTWNIYSTGNNWATAGCQSDGTDRVATPSAQTSVGTSGGRYSFTGLAADVEGFINSTLPNYGWHIARDDAGNDGNFHQFSSEEATDGDRPTLTVIYAAAGGQTPSPWRLQGGMGALLAQ